jgi:hypothetical protein
MLTNAVRQIKNVRIDFMLFSRLLSHRIAAWHAARLLFQCLETKTAPQQKNEL